MSTLKTKFLSGPGNDIIVGGPTAYGRALILSFALPLLQWHLAFRDLSVLGEVLIVMDDSFAWSGAGKTTNIAPGRNNLVAIVVVFMSFLLRADAQSTTHISVGVVVVMVVMPAEIILHPLATIDQKVVVCVVVTAPIIIVHVLLGRVVVDEEVMVNFSPLHDHRWLA